MARYFHGSSEFQAADGMQTLHLMNPNHYVPYSDTHQGAAAATNMFFLNPTGLQQAPPPNNHHRFLDLPIQTQPSASTRLVGSDDPHRPWPLHGLFPGFHSNLWGASSLDHQNSLGSSHPPQVASAAADNSGQQQQPQVPTMSLADDVRMSGNSPSSVSVVSNGISGAQSVVLGSKYLRAAQELLDEVVNVRKVIKTDVSEGTKGKIKVNKEPAAAGENETKHGAELTTAQRQDLQMKKSKLITILDEVEQRYRQYRHQMQIVVSSFERVAGYGAAKSYTSLALKTISKQFRCLKDAISGQIKATSKSLGEEDWSGPNAVEGSRLRFVDHQLRQQRALQQLGVVQHNAWRPQRGLPERAVSVLRAWLFEHFLHPSALEANGRRNVHGGSERTRKKANETAQKESGSSSNGQQDSVSFMIDQVKTQSQTDQFSNSTISTSPMGGSFLPQTAFDLIGSTDLDGASQRIPKKPRGTVSDMQNSPSSILSMDMEMKQGEERVNKNSYLFPTGTENPDDGFAAYGPMGEIGRFDPNQLTPMFPGNSVSLTLGLPHCDNYPSLSGNIQVGRLELGAPESHSTTFEMQNGKRFAAQLLPDFVA
ncbi:BEL1-like homeodomain protein 10 [Hibiscus syriacus]|uniref:BEL1-like homeodomain protein 10 n=1 Tax=Hibiscus syriacus TaxID=106335 RepID=A0A6A2YB48_HIBSY|nr:BEL1-like homeodomain protein 10 [Hibiscus syriacus]